MLRILIIIALSGLVGTTAKADWVLSVSASGKFIVINSQEGKKVLMNSLQKKVLCELDSLFEPVSWIKDSVLILQEEKEMRAIYRSYNINTGEYKVLDSIAKKDWDLMGSVCYGSCPLHIESWEQFFIVFYRDNKLYRYSFKEQKATCIYELALASEEDIDNISVNYDGTQLVVSLAGKTTGRHLIIYPDKQRSCVLNKFKTFGSSGSQCYFVNADNIVLFNVAEKNDVRKTVVEVFNTKRCVKKKLTTVEHLTLVNPYALPLQHEIAINALAPPSYSVDLSKEPQGWIRLLDDYFSSMHTVAFKYHFDRVKPD
ncbi:hypothetical protein [Chitinophaga varians]|uniref:hypothetical protein n=1 Tax=Chitinophaga varians TaxID=2202339 RepID=UPI00165F3699|nr:hypothetical protein [Chitinophaga varians]MBC9914024.1 hypothetical protein [Chitinophaga varians]